jgi:hypothetical protein
MFHVTDEKCNCEKDFPFQKQVLRRESGVVKKEGPFLGHSGHTSVLKMKTAYFYETSASVHKITWCHHLEDHNMCNHY